MNILRSGRLPILFAATTCLLAQERPDTAVLGETGAQLQLVATQLERVGASGVALCAADGKVLFAGPVGKPDPDAPLTANTLFEIASATKQFTGAALCLLAADGKLDLDSSIADHLPGVPEDCRAITVRHLLQHTSGIPGTNVAGGERPLEQAVQQFLAGGPRHTPGTHWEYWNQGYSLAAAIVERVGGTSYQEFCAQRLFAPAGMTTACFTGDALPAGATQATGRGAGKERLALEHPYGAYGWQYKGMGGAVASVWDLWAWDRALHTERPLDAAAKTMLFEVGMQDYALGWKIAKRPRRMQSHGGAVRGFVCEVRRYPDDDACLFVLCNDDRDNPGRIATLLANAMFGGECMSPPLPLAAEEQSALVGSYDDRGTRIDIEAEGPFTKAYICWGGHRPRRSSTFVGRDDDGALVLYEWTSRVSMTMERDGDQIRVTLGKSLLERRQ